MAIPNYRVVLSFDPERKVFQARAPELEHCHGEGGSRADAIGKLEEEIQAQVDNMLAHGSNPPPPVDEAALPGDLRVKLSHTLHRELVWQARQEGVEVEQLVSELLAAGLAGGRGQRARGGAPARPQQPDANHHDNIGNTVGGGRANRGYGNNNRYSPAFLDDRANFIEYVRNLEQGQQQGAGYRGGGPGGGGAGGGGGPGGQNRNRRRGGPGGGGGGGRGPGNGSYGGGSGSGSGGAGNGRP